MSNERYEKMFRKILNEAPVNVSEPPAGDIGVKTDHPGLRKDLEDTTAQLQAVSAEKQEALGKMNEWISTAENLAREINDTSPDSWVNTIKKVSQASNKDAIVTQLGKAAKVLDDIKNSLRTIVNTESGMGAAEAPENNV